MSGAGEVARIYKATHRSDPAVGGVVIDYSGGDQDIVIPVRWVYIGTAGALKVDMANGNTLTFSGLLAGNMYRMAITKIYQTGSTAAGNVLE